MFLKKSNVLWVSTFRHFNTSNVLFAAKNRSSSHYDALGLSPKATHADIKSAYYELSKIYHPDKNPGSEENAFKFREITEAYETLGNVRLRKMYDRGMYHTAARPIARHEEPDDDPVAKFYKAREKRHQVPNVGRTTIYDFDEWSRAHYGTTFRKDQTMKSKQEFQERLRQEDEDHKYYDTMLFALILVFLIALIIFREDYDDVSHVKTGKRNDSKNAKNTMCLGCN